MTQFEFGFDDDDGDDEEGKRKRKRKRRRVFFHDHMTIMEAREIVNRLKIPPSSVVCPVCKQLAKEYPRPMLSMMTLRLTIIYGATLRGETDAEGYIHIPSLLKRSKIKLKSPGDGDTGKLGYLCLIEEKLGAAREDGGRTGMWRITDVGIGFLTKGFLIPRRVKTYDSKVIEYSPEYINVTMTAENFNLQDLLDSEL